MGKRGKPGKTKWVIAEWLEEIDGDDFWITIIAVVGWTVAIAAVLLWR